MTVTQKNNAFNQFDSQRTLFEGLRLIALVIWFLYAFFTDPFSPIQVTAFVIVILISLLNTIKLASQTIKNKEGSFYSQFGGLIFLYWIFLHFKVRNISEFVSFNFFGLNFDSVFQFEKQLLGIALVIASFMFNIIDANLKIKSNQEKNTTNQLLLSYTFRAMAMSLFLVVLLTLFTWLPNFPDKFMQIEYIDAMLGLACIFMLTYGFTSLNITKTGGIAFGLGVMIFILINYANGFIDLFGVIGVNNTVSLQPYWQDVIVFLFILGITINIIFSSDSNRKTTDTRKKKAKRKKQKPVSLKTKEKMTQQDRIQRFFSIIHYSTSNINLDRVAGQLKFNSIEKLEEWLVELNLDNLIINWERGLLIISDELKNETSRKRKF